MSSNETNTNPIQWQDFYISSPIPSEINSQIQWQDHPTPVNTGQREQRNNQDFFDINCRNLSVEERFKNVIGSRDVYTQEVFNGEDEVYFCCLCNMAYHKQTWEEEIDQKCINCQNDKDTIFYKLPSNTKNIQ
jgi:hypothetical protein